MSARAESLPLGAGDGRSFYVDDDAPPGGDGLTWPTAHRFLQDALDAARAPSSGVAEIRIGQGVYKPDQGASVTPLDDQASFWIPGGLTLAGGYAGVTGRDPDARNVSLFVTTFSGDLLGNDGPLGTFDNNGENSINIAQVPAGESDATFTGIRFIRSRPQTSPASEGGAIRSQNGGMIVEQCVFEGNISYRGGAIALRTARGAFTKCSFALNRSTIGGAMYLNESSVVELNDCVYTANVVQSGGGGALVCGSNTQLDATNCRFVSNRSTPADGGALFIASSAPARFTNCLFQGNNGDYGGAINGPLEATDCDFIQNGAYASGAVYAGLNSSFTNCRFVHNVAAEGSGAVSAVDGRFANCLFIENESIYSVGGAFRGGGTFVNCSFQRNLAFTGGGAVAAGNYLASTFVNSTFTGNRSITGPSAILASPILEMNLNNCTLFGNTSDDSSACIEQPADIANSIIWGNSGPAFAEIGDVTFCCVQGGWSGQGNVDDDPLFVNALGLDGIAGTGDDDLRLRLGSPCIDSGNNALVPPDVLDVDSDGDTSERMPWDIEGEHRIVNTPKAPNTGFPANAQTLVDRGAYEFHDFRHVVGDVTHDGVVNVNDLLAVITAWGACPKEPQTCLADEAPLASGGDGLVNVLDLQLVLESWSNTQTP